MSSGANPPDEDLNPLGHMLVASSWAISIAEGHTRQDSDRDSQLYLAIIKAVEVVGEAATRVSDATQNNASSIPWAQIIGMRNRLVHGYDDIRRGRVWNTVQEDLPPLIADLRQLLPDDFVPIPIR